jgi:hypothetical protein
MPDASDRPASFHQPLSAREPRRVRRRLDTRGQRRSDAPPSRPATLTSEPRSPRGAHGHTCAKDERAAFLYRVSTRIRPQYPALRRHHVHAVASSPGLGGALVVARFVTFAVTVSTRYAASTYRTKADADRWLAQDRAGSNDMSRRRHRRRPDSIRRLGAACHGTSSRRTRGGQRRPWTRGGPSCMTSHRAVCHGRLGVGVSRSSRC